MTLGALHGREMQTKHNAIIFHRIEKRSKHGIAFLEVTAVAAAAAQVENLLEKRVGGEAEVTAEIGAIALAAGVDLIHPITADARRSIANIGVIAKSVKENRRNTTAIASESILTKITRSTTESIIVTVGVRRNIADDYPGACMPVPSVSL